MTKPAWLLLVLALFSSSGCEVAVNMGEMMDKMSDINGALKSELGMDAQVGWNIQNGTLTQISVTVPAEDAGSRTVQELKKLTYPIIRKYFDEDPAMFQVAVYFPM